jgi:hypothetical protein
MEVLMMVVLREKGRECNRGAENKELRIKNEG